MDRDTLMPRQHLNQNLHMDMSTSFGVGFVFDDQFAGWHLTEGWAETVALELAIYWLLQMGFHDSEIMICSDNTGVIDAFLNGRSCNPA